ncbi:glycine dehydrogenase (decarboxylating) alpha subunit [Thiohalospira halophila DSM 15071]|uniref:Probable glycine dehydrogenase (decarboxylating) subunit 1 n=1 Tax=Thiohalospira halophila DSM 15071 TaxID=1123397 RepID=A0A1I1SIJ7_9GAMM|nr:aminomethyl-transferring glycine dehydrogenase subunit GcvPA [Thiohalospira halophila]SFD42870.1 glycine dehydrogenase (decarboxylating) alpha subunit [Thiohalospira halophila DSM 15071]
MPFIPHTEEEVRAMLDAIGESSMEALFDEIPAELRSEGLTRVPPGASEMQVGQEIRQRAAADGQPVCFMGAGAYEHHIPAAVWELTTRGEFYSAYTPYQAEASQGTLQVVYEFQTMMAHLTGMDASNASMYDGASALAEAALMAVRANRKAKSKRILIPESVHPVYRRVVETIVHNQGLELETLGVDPEGGHIDPAVLPEEPGTFAGLVVPQPNYFGVLEDVDALTDWAHAHGGLVIGQVNPTAMAVLTPPGEWGTEGADIACGEGQPLGAPLSSGGPYFGFMTCKQSHVRQLPGRIVGGTIDADERRGYTLTLQAREQHIRRSKATSNICTNQGLLATAATIYLSLMGPDGLERVATASHANTRKLVDALTAIDGVEKVFDRPCFHEVALRTEVPADRLLDALAAEGILGGVALGEDYPELGDAFLVCATEVRTDDEIRAYADAVARILPTLRD